MNKNGVYLVLCLILLSSCRKNESVKRVELQRDSISTLITSKTCVNIYVENSGSMDSYIVSPSVTNSLFLNTLGMLVSDLELKYKGNVAVYLLSDPHKQLKAQDRTQIDASESFMRTFQGIYRIKRSNRTSNSKLDLLLGYVAKHTQQDTVSIFFSDLIFSDSQASPQDALYGIFTEYKTPLLLYRMVSDYSGFYYSEGAKGKCEQINSPRPFFIAIMGKEKFLAEMASLTSLSDDALQSHIYFSPVNIKNEQACEVESNNADIIEKRVRRTTANNSKSRIIHVKKLRKGENGIHLTLKLNLSQIPLDDDYLTDTANYVCTGYDIVDIKRIKSRAGYTHSIQLKAQRGYPSLELALKKRTNNWMTKYSANCDYPILKEQSREKTYHLNLLLSGIIKAYGFDEKAKTMNENNYFTVKVTLVPDSPLPIGKMVVLCIVVLGIVLVLVKFIRNKQYK